MAKRIPSSANLFKQLLKEEPVVSNSDLNVVDSLTDIASTPVITNTSINSSQIEDVVKVMEKAASEEIKDSIEPSESLQDVKFTDAIVNKPTNKANIRKNNTVKSSKEKAVAERDSSIPVIDKSFDKSLLIKKTIYLNTEQILQLRIRAAYLDCDGSKIVRDAIDAYFKIDSK